MRRAIGSVKRKRCDQVICERVMKLEEYQAAPLVLSYISFGNEVDTKGFITKTLKLGKQVAVPKCHSGKMNFYLIDSLADVHPSYMGILEPDVDTKKIVTQKMQKGSVCIVPGLVFDCDGYRVGYGGGYYDKYLAFYMGEKIGLARSMQVSSNPLPIGPQDVRVDTLVTEFSSFRITLH